MNPRDLPVYQQRERILEALEHNRVIVVESPTGSGKTTQLPLILHEAGYSVPGVIGVTQPRRIAAVSVSDYIARQLGQQVGGLVGYKMRFDDRTSLDTRLKIMTDGILLQEIKADLRLSQYSVIMVDEAHERSLNIDFVLGLLKRALEQRSDLRIIVSSATINADTFSAYFDGCPVVRIDTQMYPVQIIYDDPQPPQIPETGEQSQLRYQAERLAYDAIVDRVALIVERLHREQFAGDVLAFLSGEQMIKDCMSRLLALNIHKKLYILPLYGRLSKEEQDRVFPPPPAGKTKVVLATNIAETSITIDGITAVIDTGLAKINFYNPKTFTSSLIESTVSKAGANQRRGRAGRTQPGRCYRLYSRNEFENRPLFTTEEIYRTDLSEVVLRMAELGIRDFEQFDFVSSPGTRNILGAIETLRLLEAIDEQRELTAIGRMMAIFPLLPRHSRIIVEAIRTYPRVLEEVLVAVSFLTSQTPFVLPPGEELAARKAHHRYRDPMGDFVSYLRLFTAYQDAPHKGKFCDQRYLDERTMAEIANVKQQLGEIVSGMGIPISQGGPVADYLSSIARGLIQFVCVHAGKGIYQSLTAERILIHPGSVMFRETPNFIVAGEVVRTSRTYARSVSPLQREWLQHISPQLYEGLTKNIKGARKSSDTPRKAGAERDTTWQIQIAGRSFKLVPGKGKKKVAILPWHELLALYQRGRPQVPGTYARLKSRVELGHHTLLEAETLATTLRIVEHLIPAPQVVSEWPRKKSFDGSQQYRDLILHLSLILQLAPVKKGGKQLGFVALYSSPRDGRYWFKPARSFLTAVQESLAALDQLADQIEETAGAAQLEAVNAIYRRLSAILESDV